jgi:ectoine hydroxylase-related dioxygenase (phytanoyl-CoA dioxygenase family)
MAASLTNEGFQIVQSVLSKVEVDELRTELSELNVAAGYRQLMRLVPKVAALAVCPKILKLLGEHIGLVPFPVRSIFFDKTPDANWLVPWHQDLSIATKQQVDLPGYGPWSTKNGIPHVQPPVEVLESMVTIRLHLDDCDESNGALRVIPESHRRGRLSAGQKAEIRSGRDEVICSARAGDALLLRPLLLHASSEARMPDHRRVIHLEYATGPLAEGLEWAETSQRSA